MRERRIITRFLTPKVVERAKDSALPDGVCGRIIGRACVYNTPDSYGTMFKPGCFDKTRAEKVAGGKVPFFRDHEHTTGKHVGVVRETPDIGNALMMHADLFDTAEGRDTLEYTKTVMAADAYTGLSVGVYIRGADLEPDPTDPQEKVYAFSEVELAEISCTPMPAVPGSDVLNARRSPEDRVHGLLVVLRSMVPNIPRKELLDALNEFGLGEIVDLSATPSIPRDAAPGHTPTDTEIRRAVAAVAAVPYADRLRWSRESAGTLLDVPL